MSGKTGTTEAHRSAGFLGYTNRYAGVNYIYDDSPDPGGICSFPLRQCYDRNLFGGNEPAETWFAAMTPVRGEFRRSHAATDRVALRGRRPWCPGAPALPA